MIRGDQGAGVPLLAIVLLVCFGGLASGARAAVHTVGAGESISAALSTSCAKPILARWRPCSP